MVRSSPSPGLGRVAGSLAAAAGTVSLFGTYWDDAWHTDRGRDDAWVPPHLALYGGVAVVGVLVAVWAVRTLIVTRSLRRSVRNGPLALTCVAGTVVLAAAPADAWWHTAFGRDAVLWSPPHILVVFGSTALIVGLFAGLEPTVGSAQRAALGALLVGDLLIVVMEYDTDVPQFADWWYAPVLVAGAVLGAELTRRLAPNVRWPVTRAVLIYVGLRLAVMLLLSALGHSTPDLPIAVLGLCVADLPWRQAADRMLASSAATAALAWLAAVTGLSSVAAGPVGVVAAAIMAVWALSAIGLRLRRPSVAVVLLLGLGIAGGAVAAPQPATAHDPGQGESLQTVQATAVSDGRGSLTLNIRAARDCDRLRPDAVHARRGGETRSAPLTLEAPCQFSGAIQVPDNGRWFLYATLHRDGGTAEVWLPIAGDRSTRVDQQRLLYQPPDRVGSPIGKYAAGAALYLVGVVLLGAAATQVMRRPRAGEEEASRGR